VRLQLAQPPSCDRRASFAWLDSAVTNDTRGSAEGPAAIAASKRRSTVEREFDLDQLHRPPKKIGPAERSARRCNTPGCLAAPYNDFFRGKNVACLVYRDVTDTMRAPTSTLNVRGE
jgi:hypothetical protein